MSSAFRIDAPWEALYADEVMEGDPQGGPAGRQPLASKAELIAHLGQPSDSNIFADVIDSKLLAASERIEGFASMTGRYFNPRSLTAIYYGNPGDPVLRLPGSQPKPDGGGYATTLEHVAAGGRPTTLEMSIFARSEAWYGFIHDVPDMEIGDYLRVELETLQVIVPAPVKEATLKLAAALLNEREASPGGIDHAELLRLVRPYSLWRV